MKPSHRSEVATVLLLLCGYFTAIFWPEILGLKTFFIRDFGSYSYPVLSYAKYSIVHTHQMPLWDGYNLEGIPFFAQWSTMLLYPPIWLGFLFPLSWFLPVFMLSHLILGGLGFYYLTKQLGGSANSAVIVACAYAASPLGFSCLIWPQYVAAYGLAPWVLFTLKRTALLHDTDSYIIAVILLALQIMTGMPEFTLMTWIVALVLLPRQAFRTSSAIVIALCLCAIQLLPFLTLLLNSNRVGTASADWGVSLQGVFNLLFPWPNLVHTPYGDLAGGQKLITSYTLPYFLVLSIFVGWEGVRNQSRLVWLAIFGIILTVLPAFPTLYGWYESSPLGIIRYPVKFTFLILLSLCVFLSTYDKIGQARKSLLVALLMLTGVAMFVGTLVHLLILAGLSFLFILGLTKLKHPLFLGCVTLLGCYVMAPIPPSINRSLLPMEISTSDSTLGISRLQRNEVIHIDPDLVTDHQQRVALQSRNRNLNTLTPSAGGFFSAYLKRQYEISGRIYTLENPIESKARIHSFLGVGATNLVNIGLTPMIEVKDPLEATLHADLLEDVVLESPTKCVHDTTAMVLRSEWTNHKIQILARSSTNVILVLSQTWYPCWHAYLDSKPVPILHANYAFQAIEFPAGEHKVTLIYEDQQYRVGKFISISTLICLFLSFYPGKSRIIYLWKKIRSS